MNQDRVGVHCGRLSYSGDVLATLRLSYGFESCEGGSDERRRKSKRGKGRSAGEVAGDGDG
ncbi:hypothetical protein A2U01_0073442, partial [Trifolium medium]|nr:hypothetical protein [Trifolium medium]